VAYLGAHIPAVQDTALCTGDTRMHDKSHTQSFDTYEKQIYVKVYLNFQYSPYS